MMIISAELSGKSKAILAKTIRTEGYTQCSQGQSVGDEIILPRGRAISNGDEKVRRYPVEMLGCKIKNLLEHLTKRIFCGLFRHEGSCRHDLWCCYYYIKPC